MRNSTFSRRLVHGDCRILVGADFALVVVLKPSVRNLVFKSRIGGDSRFQIKILNPSFTKCVIFIPTPE